MSYDEIATDVLVIGGGGAGARAAIEASKENVSVIIVSKSEFPSGCTSVAMGAMQAAFGPKDGKEIHQGKARLHPPKIPRKRERSDHGSQGE